MKKSVSSRFEVGSPSRPGWRFQSQEENHRRRKTDRKRERQQEEISTTRLQLGPRALPGTTKNASEMPQTQTSENTMQKEAPPEFTERRVTSRTHFELRMASWSLIIILLVLRGTPSEAAPSPVEASAVTAEPKEFVVPAVVAGAHSAAVVAEPSARTRYGQRILMTV